MTIKLFVITILIFSFTVTNIQSSEVVHGPSEVVTFNIRGTERAALRSTLLKVPHSKLARIINNKEPHPRDPKGHLFLDVPLPYFDLLMDWLRQEDLQKYPSQFEHRSAKSQYQEFAKMLHDLGLFGALAVNDTTGKSAVLKFPTGIVNGRSNSQFGLPELTPIGTRGALYNTTIEKSPNWRYVIPERLSAQVQYQHTNLPSLFTSTIRIKGAAWVEIMDEQRTSIYPYSSFREHPGYEVVDMKYPIIDPKTVVIWEGDFTKTEPTLSISFANGTVIQQTVVEQRLRHDYPSLWIALARGSSMLIESFFVCSMPSLPS